MNVSVFYRSVTVWNIILFTLLMFFFLFFQEGLFYSKSVFDKEFAKQAILSLAPLIGVLAVTAFSVFKLKKSSKVLFLLSIFSVASLTIVNLSADFSKLVVISLFLFALTSYYFYQFLKIELDEAYYNPQYDMDNLFDPMLKKLACEVHDSESGAKYQGVLTNWNLNGCFVSLEDFGDSGQALKKVVLTAFLEDRTFKAAGSLASMTKDKKGIGLRLSNKREEEFGWRDYYSVIDQMGYKVEMLK